MRGSRIARRDGSGLCGRHLGSLHGAAIRYAESHRRQTHSRIVENASYGLRQKGAEGFSVVDLMKLAGLTHGGFYNHFDLRAALVGEAIAFAMDQMTERWKKLADGKANAERFEALIADYLSPRHRDNPRHGCALPTLAADVARSSPSEQQALASKLEKMIDVLSSYFPMRHYAPFLGVSSAEKCLVDIFPLSSDLDSPRA